MKPKAILLGLVAWFNLSLILGVPLVLYLKAHSQVDPRPFMPLLLSLVRLMDMATAFLGGYVAGRVARTDELTAAAVTGAIIAVLRLAGLLALLRRHPAHLSTELLVVIFGFAAAVCGGWLAKWRNEKTAARQPLQPAPLSSLNKFHR